MRKTIYNKFDKRAITALPVLKFPGRIIVIMSEGETEKAVDYLLSSDILGVDTETRPSFIVARCTKWRCCKCLLATPVSCFV